jgi:RNA polymerase sigma factor FliA
MNTAVRAYQQASENPVEKLILDNVDFVRKILSTMLVGLPEHCDRENLEQAGIVGLVEAAKNFDPSREVQFRTFAYCRIRGAIIDELRKNSLLPQRLIEQISELRQVSDALGEPATPEILAEKLGWTESQVLETLEATRFSQPNEWTDLNSEVARIRSRTVASPDAELESRELKKRLADCIEQLPERERLVLVMYYTEDLTLLEIGTVIGLSESRVSRLLAAAKFRLKEMLEHGNQ